MPQLKNEEILEVLAARTSVDTFLRRVCACSWIWCLAFILPYAIISHAVVPALIIIPMTLSLCISVFHLVRKEKSPKLNAVLDLGTGLFLLGMLVPGTIMVRRNGWWRGEDLIMVGAYGMVPSMINCVIHTYFALREASILHVFSLIFGNVFSSTTCPHCQREVLDRWGFTSTPSASSVSKESYISIHQHDGDDVEGRPSSSKGHRVEDYREPRPSTDDESARLV